MDPVAVAIILAIIASPTGAVIASKYFRPNATPLELLEAVTADNTRLHGRVDRLEKRDRVSTDYMHQLRQHIAEGNPPPPPPWPTELNQ